MELHEGLLDYLVFRLEIDRSLESALGFLHLLDGGEGAAEADIGVNIARVELDSLLKVFDRLFFSAHIRKGHGDVEVALRALF